MKFNTSFPEVLKPHFKMELAAYKRFMQKGEFHTAWKHLERAHIIGQSFPYEHTLVHWKMLLFGFTIKNSGEIIGQLPRLLIGGVKSFVGKVPIGNTGGANIPPLRCLPLENDIKNLLDQVQIVRR